MLLNGVALTQQCSNAVQYPFLLPQYPPLGPELEA